MKNLFWFLLLFVVGLPFVKAQSKVDSLAIMRIISEQESAWNLADARAYAQSFSDKGTFTNIKGMFFTGQKAFLDRHEEIFRGLFAQTRLKQEVGSFRFLTSEIAIIETLCLVSGFSKERPPQGLNLNENGQVLTRLLQVMQKEEQVWKIVAYHNVDLKPGVPVKISR